MKSLSIFFFSLLLIIDVDIVEAQNFQIPNPFNGVENIDTDVRRGRGFGGFRRRSSSRRRSFGGSRSRRSRKSSQRTSRSRSRKPAMARSKNAPSFGGRRMSSSQAQQRYGKPRRTERVTANNHRGVNTPYVVNHYGGYGSGLMMGYMMGSSMWYWSMPFHPAYYYSRPVYVEGENGQVSVYPPTFSFGRLMFTLIVLAVIIFVIRNLFFKRNNYSRQRVSGSFG